MRPNAIRDFLIRTASVIEKTGGVVSKDAALVNPQLTPTSVLVATSLIEHPITEDEETKFGMHVDSAIHWYKEYNGTHAFTQTIKEHVTGVVRPNANVMVWAVTIYEGELKRTHRISTLRDKILSAIDPILNDNPIDGKISGTCGVIDIVNSAQGARYYHLVDLDTKRYMKYSAYGKITLHAEGKYAYSAMVRDYGPDYMLDGLPVTRLARPSFKPVLN